MNTARKQTIFLCMALLWMLVTTTGFSRQAQSHVAVSGIVKDEKGEALPGVTVAVKLNGNATTKGVQTDEKGLFRFTNLDAGGPYSFVFTYVGYESQTLSGYQLKAGEQLSLVVKMKEVSTALNQVVVVGYGTQKQVNLTGAISTLDMRTKENTPVTSASQALHGVSGLWVNQAGGKPGQDGATIRVRGVGTLNNNNPLVLVDGVEYDINEINPDFIDNITVLKDASAAIYGSRAANGVVLITTKSGKKGKVEVNYSYSYGIQNPTALPDVVWDPIQYMQMKDQALINEGKSPAAVDYTPAQIEEYKNGMATNPYAYPNLNWFDLVLKNGTLQQHNLRFSGGSDNVLYSIALGYMDQDGILIAANHANRYTLDVNVSANVSKRLHVGTSIIGNYRTYTEPAFGGSDATGYYFTRLTRVLPIFSPYTQDGKYGSSVFATPGRNTIENPLMLLKEGSNYHAPQRLLAKVYADYKLPFDITYNINLGIDKLDGYARSFVPYLVTYNPKTGAPNNYNINPSSNSYDDNNLNISFFQTLNWERDFNSRHHLNVMAGTSYNRFDNTNTTAHIEGYFDNTLTDLDAGSLNPTANGRVTKDVLASYFGRVNYSYAEKYLLEATLRYDGSSRFASGNRWGLYPAVSAGWRIDKEGFFGQSKIIDLLKLRASYGKLGNQGNAGNAAADLFGYMNTVNLGQDYSFNNTVNPGAAVTKFSDPNISWETTTAYNIGADASAWNGKLAVSVDVFKRRTEDILRPVQIAQQGGGLAGPVTNVGTVDNKGYELTVTHRNDIGAFNYSISGNVSYVQNKVISLNGESIIGTRRITKAGSPIDAYYLYQAIGIFQSQEEVDNSAKISNAVKPGYVKYADLSGPDGKPDGKIDAYDRVIAGSSIPKYNYSFNVHLGYKGLSLDAFFQGVQGINLYPTVNLAMPFNNGAGVTKDWVNNSWTPDNPNATLPILTTATGATENFQPSTFWLKNGSYLRMKNLQLKYELPQGWLTKVKVKRVAVFANGENLLTFTKFKDFDPEKNIQGDTFYEYPSLKTYSFGVNVTF